MPDFEQEWGEEDLEEEITDKRATDERSLYVPELPRQQVGEKVSQTVSSNPGRLRQSHVPFTGDWTKRKKNPQTQDILLKK